MLSGLSLSNRLIVSPLPLRGPRTRDQNAASFGVINCLQGNELPASSTGTGRVVSPPYRIRLLALFTQVPGTICFVIIPQLSVVLAVAVVVTVYLQFRPLKSQWGYSEQRSVDRMIRSREYIRVLFILLL